MAAVTTKEKRFSASDLCSIINACSKNNVQKLTLGGLSVEFYPKEVKFYQQVPKTDKTQAPSWDFPVATHVTDEADLTKPVEDAHTKELLENMRFTETLINSPVEFENQMIDSLMEDKTERTTS